MKTSGSNFELIMQDVLKQKQLLEDLQTENDVLHHQLVDLHEGRGILLDILGERFPLAGEPIGASPDAVATVGADLSLQETTVKLSETLPSSLPNTLVPASVTAPNTEEVLEDRKQLVTSAPSVFLEEDLLDEFSKASTKQIEQVAVLSGPTKNPPWFDEKEKETLRRELSDSFLLE